MWAVYLLVSETGSTYVGMTNNLDRRLSQHNRLQSGGAAATAGHSWTRVCHVRGFPDQTAALQFEWAWKHRTKHYKGLRPPLRRRTAALQELLAEERPTSLAAPYSSYPTPLEVMWESEQEIPSL